MTDSSDMEWNFRQKLKSMGFNDNEIKIVSNTPQEHGHGHNIHGIRPESDRNEQALDKIFDDILDIASSSDKEGPR